MVVKLPSISKMSVEWVPGEEKSDDPISFMLLSSLYLDFHFNVHFLNPTGCTGRSINLTLFI